MENSELVAKVEQWLSDLSVALHRLGRRRQVHRETRTQTMMGAMLADQAEANLSRLAQWRDEDRTGLPADIVPRLRRAGL
jgi:hypothetical protein